MRGAFTRLLSAREQKQTEPEADEGRLRKEARAPIGWPRRGPRPASLGGTRAAAPWAIVGEMVDGCGLSRAGSDPAGDPTPLVIAIATPFVIAIAILVIVIVVVVIIAVIANAVVGMMVAITISAVIMIMARPRTERRQGLSFF